MDLRRTRNRRRGRTAHAGRQRCARPGQARMTLAPATGAIGPRRVPSYSLLVAGLAVLVFLLFVLSLHLGYANLDVARALRDLLSGQRTLAALVLVELRLPRALLGAIVGFSLGLSGAAMQGLMRNPLAEPGIIGVPGTAALGAGIAFYFGWAGTISFALPLRGGSGRAVAAFLLFCLGRGHGRT